MMQAMANHCVEDGRSPGTIAAQGRADRRGHADGNAAHVARNRRGAAISGVCRTTLGSGAGSSATRFVRRRRRDLGARDTRRVRSQAPWRLVRAETLPMLLRTLSSITLLAVAAVRVQAQDAAAGGMAFQQCAECHSPGSADGAGPGLKGVFGRRAGGKDGFIYSPAMKKAALTWDDKTLDAFLADPRAVVPGTTMAYAGDEDAKERADLVAYLKTLK
jgi:cytochrome c